LPELAIALATGTAEGQDNAPFHLVANVTYESIRYFSMINYMWMGCTMAINANTWNRLSRAQQDILREQALIAAKFSFDTIAQDDQTATQHLQNFGVEFNFEPDVQSFRDMLGGSEYYQRYADEPWFNQSIISALLGE
jgi:TRAP-type C4-dicarboxylate transport system substrate-binding protein